MLFTFVIALAYVASGQDGFRSMNEKEILKYLSEKIYSNNNNFTGLCDIWSPEDVYQFVRSEVVPGECSNKVGVLGTIVNISQPEINATGVCDDGYLGDIWCYEILDYPCGTQTPTTFSERVNYLCDRLAEMHNRSLTNKVDDSPLYSSSAQLRKYSVGNSDFEWLAYRLSNMMGFIININNNVVGTSIDDVSWSIKKIQLLLTLSTEVSAATNQDYHITVIQSLELSLQILNKMAGLSVVNKTVWKAPGCKACVAPYVISNDTCKCPGQYTFDKCTCNVSNFEQLQNGTCVSTFNSCAEIVVSDEGKRRQLIKQIGNISTMDTTNIVLFECETSCSPVMVDLYFTIYYRKRGASKADAYITRVQNALSTTSLEDLISVAKALNVDIKLNPCEKCPKHSIVLDNECVCEENYEMLGNGTCVPYSCPDGQVAINYTEKLKLLISKINSTKFGNASMLSTYVQKQYNDSNLQLLNQLIPLMVKQWETNIVPSSWVKMAGVIDVNTTNSVSLNKNATLLAVGKYGNRGKIFSVRPEGLMDVTPVELNSFYHLEFSPDGNSIALLRGNAEVKVYNFLDGSFTTFSNGSTASIRMSSWSPDGNSLQ